MNDRIECVQEAAPDDLFKICVTFKSTIEQMRDFEWCIDYMWHHGGKEDGVIKVRPPNVYNQMFNFTTGQVAKNMDINFNCRKQRLEAIDDSNNPLELFVETYKCKSTLISQPNTPTDEYGTKERK